MTEQTFLQPDGAADSPLPDYPGRIKFPLVMTLVMHKAWQRFVNARAERDPEDPRIGVAFTGDGEPTDSERVMFTYDDVELALLFGDLDVTGPDGKHITSKAKLDALPMPVAVWIARCYREWENSQLFFRWSVAASVVAPDSAA